MLKKKTYIIVVIGFNKLILFYLNNYKNSNSKQTIVFLK